MLDYPFAYEKIAPTTWAYLSSLLMLALFFKFNRFWSVRNFDLFLIILLAPGIILVDFGKQLEGTAIDNVVQVSDSNAELSNAGSTESNSGNVDALEEVTTPANDPVLKRSVKLQLIGFYWLLSMCLVFLIRTLLDPLLVRRPLLAPNLNVGGLVFFMFSLMTFLYANILTAQPTPEDLSAAESALKMVQREVAEQDETKALQRRGPGLPLFQLFPIIPTFSNGRELLETDAEQDSNIARYAIASKSLAILSQSAIVLGLILIGYFHFADTRVGFGMASIYLMLPYTAQYMGNVAHVLPGAFLVWAVTCVRRPWASGIFVGLAVGTVYYPIFLLPLWISFYWEKGVKRFISGVLIAIILCIASLAFTSSNFEHFGDQLQATFGFWFPLMDGLEGIWGLGWDSSFRLPILVAFFALCISFVFWPKEKNLGTLFAYTCAIMIGVQFWHGFEGGLIMAWFMPAALMTIFRPNTDGRDAKSELRLVRQAKAETVEDIIGEG